jgi:hypothetical protein
VRFGRLRQVALVGAVACVPLLSNASAQATVTIGSQLTAAPTGTLANPADCSPTCTIVNFRTPPPAGLISPIDGVLIRWRVIGGGNLNLRALRYSGSGNVVTLVGDGTQSFSLPTTTTTAQTVPAHLPIRAGDFIGVDLLSSGSTLAYASTPGQFADKLTPAVPDGGTSSGVSIMGTKEPLFNADVVPSNTFTLGTITRNKKKGTATIVANVPNPGELTGSGNGVKAASAATAVISKSVGAGPAQLLIKAKGKKKKALNANGKVKLNVSVTYTPAGGEASTQSLKVTLKKHL